MNSVWQDIRYALRVLDRSRGFSAIAVVCLALGVGANTAVFSVVNTVLLWPLPFFDASRLAMVREVSPRATLSVSPEHFVEWKESAQSVESIAAYVGWAPNQDRSGALPVVIVNEAMARLHWPGESPVGRRIKRGTPTARFPWMTVVGVIADVKHFNITGETGPTVFFPYPQMPERGMTLVVRSNSNPDPLAGPVRAAIRGIDPDQPVASIRTFRDVYWGSLAPRGIALVWMGIFAALALVLAAVGIYGVVAASVARRTREFGIRVALGADRPVLLRMALRQAMTPVLTGIVIGLAGAAALTSLLESLIYGITARDLPTFSGAAVLLMLIALAASYIPARRAVALDPVAALRRE